MADDSLFYYTRVPDPQWTADLAAVSPRHDHKSWLELVWEAGTPEEPGQRWMLYEMLPHGYINPDILSELQGPDPRTVNRPESGYIETNITRVQWDLYQQHRAYGRAFWVIQGHNGGHKRRFTSQERKMLRLAKKPEHPPAIGDLPYAPFDRRVIAQVVRFDRLQAIGDRLNTFRRWGMYKEAQAEADLQFRQQLVKWLSEQVEEPADHFLRAARVGDVNGAPTETDWARVEEEATERFITTGAV